MTGWEKRLIRRSIRQQEQKFLESLRPKSKPVWKVPDNAPCTKCMQTVGSAICQNKCSYYLELIKMRDRGELRKV